jgi:hypothetical protein
VRGDLGDFFAEGGAIVGGAAVMGAVLGFVAGSIVKDFRPDTDPDAWARKWGMLFGIGGFVVLLERL